MKLYINKIKNTFVLTLAFLTLSCETEFVNPNAPTDVQILSSRDGLLSLSVGVLQLYSTTGLRFIIETPAITTREAAITTTFQNMIELEDGGTALPNFNTNIEGLWATMLRVMAMCNDLIENVENVPLEEGTKVGILANAQLFKAMSIGALSQNYEQVIVDPNLGGGAQFVSRIEGYNTAIGLLQQAETALLAAPISTEFDDAVLQGNIDLLNTVRTYLARYHLFAGNYEAALPAAGSVDLSSVSNFRYDLLNPNPIWARVVQNNTPNFKPRDNFGLPASLAPDPNDNRLSFHMRNSSETNQNGLPIQELRGFYSLDTQPIPVYLPSEIDLIFAEANARKASPDITQAVNNLNIVLTETNDRYGVNASLPPYSGEMTIEAVLLEIYKNRRAELFLSGVSLEDSRRFGRPEPSGEVGNFSEERNRNFYPYPLRERSNNTNTPTDPTI